MVFLLTKNVERQKYQVQEPFQGSNAIDVLKFGMVAMIVAIHTSFFKELTNPWFRIAISIFFIQSSYYFFKTLNGLTFGEKESRLAYNVKRIFFLYALGLMVLSPFVLIIKWDLLSSHGPLVIISCIIRGIPMGIFFGASWLFVALMIGVPVVLYLSKWLLASRMSLKYSMKVVLCIGKVS